MTVTFKKINNWGNETQYHAIGDGITVPFIVIKKHDKIGTLYCVECSLCGYFEEYGMHNVKSKLTELINVRSNN
jgi:hypothetical protein